MNAIVKRTGWLGLLLLTVTGLSSPAQSQGAPKVRITGLNDVNFGQITNLSLDAINAQDVCVYSKDSNYNVTAIGSGPGGAFQLTTGAETLAYEVEWSNTSGVRSGTSLQPITPLGGQSTNASHQVCQNGPPTSASLIVRIRANELSAARTGSYGGSLTLLIGAE